jgi:hypothetical protein|nr:MAG TPA: hypothetical protein [Caudoviricetes sp.]
MLKNGVFGVESGEGGSVVVQMSEMVGRLKWGDLRAIWGLEEGLYPLEGEGRFMGVSEGFMGKFQSWRFRHD